MSSTSIHSEEWSATGYLFGPAGARSVVEPLSRCLPHATVSGLSSSARRAVAQEVTQVLEEVLDVDVRSILAAAWSTHHDLADAGERTRAASDTEELVKLGSHTVTSVHRPTIDLMLNGVRLGELKFVLEMTFELAPLMATVRGGALVNVHPSRMGFEGALSFEGEPLASRRANLQLPGTLSLGSGYRLVAA